MHAVAKHVPRSAIATIVDGENRLRDLFSLASYVSYNAVETKRPLTEDERWFCEEIVRATNEALVSGDRDNAAINIAGMLNGFSSGGSMAEAAVKIDLYCKVVVGIPNWAVSRAARNFAMGTVEGQNKAFPPTVAQFAQEASRLLQIPREIRHKATLLLSSTPVRETGDRVRIDWRSMAGLPPKPEDKQIVPIDDYKPDLTPVKVSQALSERLQGNVHGEGA